MDLLLVESNGTDNTFGAKNTLIASGCKAGVITDCIGRVVKGGVAVRKPLFDGDGSLAHVLFLENILVPDNELNSAALCNERPMKWEVECCVLFRPGRIQGTLDDRGLEALGQDIDGNEAIGRMTRSECYIG